MKIKYTGRHIVLSAALKKYVQDKLERLDRYGIAIQAAEVLFEVQKSRHIAEAQILVNGRIVQGKTSTREMYQSLDVLFEKLARQLKKQKEKIKSKRSEPVAPPRQKSASKKKKRGVSLPTIRPVLQQLTVDEAVTQLQEEKEAVLVFMNATVHRIQVIRQMESGHIQLIDPKVRSAEKS